MRLSACVCAVVFSVLIQHGSYKKKSVLSGWTESIEDNFSVWQLLYSPVPMGHLGAACDSEALRFSIPGLPCLHKVWETTQSWGSVLCMCVWNLSFLPPALNTNSTRFHCEHLGVYLMHIYQQSSSPLSWLDLCTKTQFHLQWLVVRLWNHNSSEEVFGVRVIESIENYWELLGALSSVPNCSKGPPYD